MIQTKYIMSEGFLNRMGIKGKLIDVDKKKGYVFFMFEDEE